MKKFVFCLISAVFLSLYLLPLTVFADVLIEVEDSFWKKNQSNCYNSYRQYTVNGEDGYAVILESPVSSVEKETVLNGTRLSGTWHYTDPDGEVWLAVPSGEYTNFGNETLRGWIKTSQCIAVRDHISFRQEHEAEFTDYDPAYDHAFDDLKSVTLWTYPCSGSIAASEIDAGWFQDVASSGHSFEPCWRDPEGRLWGYVGYCYGIRNTWLCFDDPSGTEIPADESVISANAVIYPPAEKLPAPGGQMKIPVVATIAVLAVIAVTIVLLCVFFGKKKTDGEK